ncbi:MAG: hypothetical protein ACOYOB_21120, partial [Myxococcota bacterium]
MRKFFQIKMMRSSAAGSLLAAFALVALSTACGDKTDTSAQGDATVIADVDVDAPDGLTDQDTTADVVVPTDTTETADTADSTDTPDVAPIDGDTGGDTDVVD